MEKTLDFIVSTVVQVDGRKVLTGDLIERKETHRYWFNREARAAAEEFTELIRQQNELDRI